MEASICCACGIQLDYSRQNLGTGELESLAEKLGPTILDGHSRMLNGEIVNRSEGRPALHVLLRARKSVLPQFAEVLSERQRAFEFAEKVRSGEWKGCRGRRIKHVINIGIGGSDTGIRAVYHALRSSKQDIRIHFLASVDGILLERILAECEPERTLVFVTSKSFKTRETQVNAAAVDQWLMEAGIVGEDRARHMVVVSADKTAAAQMCLPQCNQFLMWDWIGGRFSVWGAVGLPLMIALGPEVFQEFIQGAEEMDRHSSQAPIKENLPALLAILAYRNCIKLGIKSLCVLPYDERLKYFVPWVQQLEMESLGKLSNRPTGQAVWGSNGNEGQHSFYQWLREGSNSTSIDMIWANLPGHNYAAQYRALISNAKAQAEALVNRDSSSGYFNVLSTLTCDALTPRRLGTLMALYEHKTTMLGSLYGINPFDQPGVELGKKLSLELEKHQK